MYFGWKHLQENTLQSKNNFALRFVTFCIKKTTNKQKVKKMDVKEVAYTVDCCDYKYT
jgi:hypothetical protein